MAGNYSTHPIINTDLKLCILNKVFKRIWMTVLKSTACIEGNLLWRMAADRLYSLLDTQKQCVFVCFHAFKCQQLRTMGWKASASATVSYLVWEQVAWHQNCINTFQTDTVCFYFKKAFVATGSWNRPRREHWCKNKNKTMCMSYISVHSVPDELLVKCKVCST